ncbi:MAG: hypothetical protein ABII80_00970 [bacterium]
MTDLQSFQQTLESSKSLLICLPTDPSPDVVAAGLALYLSLVEQQKVVSIVSPTLPVVRDSHLVGLDKITSSLGGNNLVITINGPEDAVDKVTSNTEGGHLNLIISTKKDLAPLKSTDLTFGYSGASADAVLIVGAQSLSDLGALAEKESEFFSTATIINFGNQPSTFGTVNFTDPSSSNCELATAVIQELKLPLTADIAGNLMLGIEFATNSLSSPDMTADTFEALAVLYRAGARIARSNTSPSIAVPTETPILEVTPEPVSTSTPFPTSAEPDWLKPKIFKGSTQTN